MSKTFSALNKVVESLNEQFSADAEVVSINIVVSAKDDGKHRAVASVTVINADGDKITHEKVREGFVRTDDVPAPRTPRRRS